MESYFTEFKCFKYVVHQNIMYWKLLVPVRDLQGFLLLVPAGPLPGSWVTGAALAPLWASR